MSDPALISIHMPLAGHDKYAMAGAANDFAFQSTCPLRGTTGRITMLVDDNVFQSTCPLRGTTFARPVDLTVQNFNPRAPCGARLVTVKTGPGTYKKFQSTCPLRGTTWVGYFRMVNGTISIHVPLAGHDHPPCRGRSPARHFNPRAPCGARQDVTCFDLVCSHFNPRAPCGARLCPPSLRLLKAQFQSTCPLRGTTIRRVEGGVQLGISIHVPLAGHDDEESNEDRPIKEFQSTCPLRGTTAAAAGRVSGSRISIHVPLAGHDKRSATSAQGT